MTTYFGFALADSMFTGEITITRRSLDAEAVRTTLRQGFVSYAKVSRKTLIDAMRERFGFDVPIPDIPPRVVLLPGDSIVVVGIRDLPRCAENQQYSKEAVAKASFLFTKYTVERFQV